MPRVFVVEGLTDAAFFQELLRRLYLRDAKTEPEPRLGRENIPKIVRGTLADGSSLEVEFFWHPRGEGGESRIPEAIRGLLRRGVLSFTVAQDIDDRSPDQVVQPIQQVVYSHLGMSLPAGSTPGRRIAIPGGAITVIPMGLYQDIALQTRGITSHSMEDYLIKLLLEDANLRQNAPELQLFLSHLLRLIRRYNGPFHSSKYLFQLLKPILNLGFSDTGAVQRVFSNADSTILRSVLAPALDDVAQAFGV